MSDYVTSETISSNLIECRPRAVIVEALSLRMDPDLATDIAGDVMVALRLNDMKVVRGSPDWLERKRARAPL